MKAGSIFTTVAIFTFCMIATTAYADIYADTQQCLQMYYTKSYTHALPFCKRAANAGNNQSQYVMGLMYIDGLGVKKNKAAAIKWLRAAAEQAHAAARYKLETLENEHDISPAIMNRLLEQTNRTQTSGNVTHAPNAAPTHIHAYVSPPQTVSPPDDKVLYQHYLAASKRGSAHARFLLGLFYLEGRSVQKNPEEAGRWLKMAARQGVAEAQVTMGQLYYKGYAGTAPNMEKAMYWFLRSAQQGAPEAQYSLGLMYASGAGGKKNETEAIKWWHQAAMQGYAKAQHNLAVMYLKGTGVKISRDKAARWFIKEAEHGDPQSQFNLGRLYSEGKWFDQNGSDSVNWFYRAGETWLEINQPKKARRCVEKIRQLAGKHHLTAANLFLADVLDRKIKETN